MQNPIFEICDNLSQVQEAGQNKLEGIKENDDIETILKCANYHCKNYLTDYELARIQDHNLIRRCKYEFCVKCRNKPMRVKFVVCPKCDESFALPANINENLNIPSNVICKNCLVN